MTNLEVIKGKLGYPLSDNTFNAVLLDRGLTGATTYASSESFNLAYADLIVTLLTTPNISEGGYSISFTDRATLMKLASGVYMRYGVFNPLGHLQPKATVINPW